LRISFLTLGVFLFIAIFPRRDSSHARIDEIKGLAARHPYLAAMLALFMLALSGFPPTAGFFGKFYIFSEAVKSGYIWLAIIGVMNSFVSVYYYLRVVVAAYFGGDQTEFRPVVYTPSIVLALLITVIGTMALGLMPQFFVDLSRQSLFPFI
jgi:NADH-quinone oxidoreductase subunit N